MFFLVKPPYVMGLACEPLTSIDEIRMPIRKRMSRDEHVSLRKHCIRLCNLFDSKVCYQILSSDGRVQCNTTAFANT